MVIALYFGWVCHFAPCSSIRSKLSSHQQHSISCNNTLLSLSRPDNATVAGPFTRLLCEDVKRKSTETRDTSCICEQTSLLAFVQGSRSRIHPCLIVVLRLESFDLVDVRQGGKCLRKTRSCLQSLTITSEVENLTRNVVDCRFTPAFPTYGRPLV